MAKAKTANRKDVIKRVVGETQYRNLSIERSALDAEKRTVEIAFSSELPVERWWGVEILDHASSSVRMQRMNDGGAMLFNHDTDQHIGVVEKASVDTDRVGRAVVRFGNSMLAEEKFKDVQDGILRHVSVGYLIHKIETTKDGKGENEIDRVTDWEPIEISFVPVPADPSVGVGRSHEDARRTVRAEGDCQCTCPECKDMNCADCSHDGCDCAGCTCDMAMGKEMNALKADADNLRAQLGDIESQLAEAQSSLIQRDAKIETLNAAITTLMSKIDAAEIAEAERMQRMKVELEQAEVALCSASDELKQSELRYQSLAEATSSVIKGLAETNSDATKIQAARPLVEEAMRAIKEQSAALENASRELKMSEVRYQALIDSISFASEKLSAQDRDVSKVQAARPLVEGVLKSIRTSIADLSRRLILHSLK